MPPFRVGPVPAYIGAPGPFLWASTGGGDVEGDPNWSCCIDVLGICGLAEVEGGGRGRRGSVSLLNGEAAMAVGRAADGMEPGEVARLRLV